MINKIWRTLFMILNRNRIPKLPRGMLSSEYTYIPPGERRVMQRIGARDPRGVKVAMKRAGVSSPEELVKLLEHQEPKREVMRRFNLAIGRVVGGEERPPHEDELNRMERDRKRKPASVEIKQRIKKAREMK